MKKRKYFLNTIETRFTSSIKNNLKLLYIEFFSCWRLLKNYCEKFLYFKWFFVRSVNVIFELFALMQEYFSAPVLKCSFINTFRNTSLHLCRNSSLNLCRSIFLHHCRSVFFAPIQEYFFAPMQEYISAPLQKYFFAPIQENFLKKLLCITP